MTKVATSGGVRGGGGGRVNPETFISQVIIPPISKHMLLINTLRPTNS